MIFRSPFPKLHYYHNKQIQVKESQYLIPTYSWTLTPISNWTCSVVTVPLFNAWLSSTWLSANLDSTYCVCVYWSCVFILFIFFFFSRVFGGMRLLFNEQCMNSSCKCWLFPVNGALFMDLQISLFSNFFIKNRSYGTIHIFKNYFAIFFSVFSFFFQQNKFYPNGPII